MSRVLRDAKRIIRRAERDGYEGSFAIVREPVMEELQVMCGRTIAENVTYQKVIEQLIKGHSICEYCEDNLECKEKQTEAWLKGSCLDFLLKLPSDEEAIDAFNGAYKYIEGKCYELQTI